LFNGDMRQPRRREFLDNRIAIRVGVGPFGEYGLEFLMLRLQ
jgi:hypothetical protein